MSGNIDIRLEDLVSNPTTRIPVAVCADTSGSMAGEPIDELNAGIRMFYDEIKKDETALYSCEICVISFGGNTPALAQDYAGIDLAPEPPVLRASGRTPMGEAVMMALDKLECRKKEYQDAGVDYFQPWLVLLSDGHPNGDPAVLKQAMDRTAQMVNSGKLTVFPIAIGYEASMEVLSRFSPKRPPLRLQGLKFRELFQWLSKSVARTSQSMPGEVVKLDYEGIKSWAEL